MTFFHELEFTEQSSTPSNPDSGNRRLYPKSGGWYELDSGGNERKVIAIATDTTNISNPPTDAELDSAFGTPATVGTDFVGIVDDNDADSAVYLVYSNGTSWWYVAMTKAT